MSRKKRRQMSDALAVSIIQPKHKATATITSEEVQSDSNTKENELFIDELEIPDDQIADILTQIEQENRQVMPQQQNSVLNLSNIQHVSNEIAKPHIVPSMYFPHSTNVTINYHVHQK